MEARKKPAIKVSTAFVLLCPLLILCPLLPNAWAGHDTVGVQTQGSNSAPGSTLDIDFQNNTISIKAKDVPLQTLLSAISKKTDLVFVLNNNLIKKDSINVRVKRASLFQGIEKILDNYSYTKIQTKEGKYLFTILGKKGVGSGPVAVKTAKSIPLRITNPDDSAPKTKNHKSTEMENIEPWQFMVLEEVPCNSEEEDCTKPKTRYVLDRDAYEAARIKQAKAILKNRKQDIFPELIQDLADMRDNPEAKELLIKICKSRWGHIPPEARKEAVQTLWNVAADEQFKNDELILTLKNLTRDPDKSVQSLARQALSDMKRYEERESHIASMKLE